MAVSASDQKKFFFFTGIPATSICNDYTMSLFVSLSYRIKKTDMRSMRWLYVNLYSGLYPTFLTT